ncbi:MAG: oxidase [Gemmatimonadetes bacterium]|nr:oxidase [Gemmatimonadota bacterium]
MTGTESSRIIPAPAAPTDATAVSPDVWGFRDTAFEISPDGHARMTGSRYGLSGVELPDLLPWIRQVLDTPFVPNDTHDSAYPPPVPAPVENPAFVAALRSIVGDEGSSADPMVRLRRGHGHALDEMYAIKYRQIDRIPDLVAFPASEEQVLALVEAATRHGVCLVPYGGGTNVSDALQCPVTEQRMIVAVDMQRMNRVLWIDAENRIACIQAGAVGRSIQAQLGAYGFTLGHEPDSVEFSTLGGWIATHASGMKKNRYGNIEDIVLDVNIVTPRGLITRTSVPPRESVGFDPRRMIFGSEGSLGIVTQAIVKIFPLPEVARYEAVLFPSFENGLAFLRDLTKEGMAPASVRLVDNLQFQLSQMLKPRAIGLKAAVRRAEKLFVTKIRGFDPARMSASTIAFEGTREQVARENAAVGRLARRHGGMRAGAENGRKGYELTFGIAYLRDFIMKHHIIAESFETSVAWSDALALCTNVKRRLVSEYQARTLPGIPFVTCRVTQLYQTGVAVYFYFGFVHKGVDRPDEVYAELENAARDEILRSGGSLSHHHGVGKIRRAFLPRVFSQASLEWAAEVKRAVDPTNTFGIVSQ